ncbi:MAG TPA: hypothetical protein PK514_14710 [Spirochaetota bacterium]|mgnify:CR=1 FL=1|nr:hypothetical protein [Spirochaetota bacterium]
MSLSRSILNALLPEGSFWEPAAGDDYDLLLDGIAENSEKVYQDLKLLAHLRNPAVTPILSDLEREYGVIPTALATEAERRSRLKAFQFRRANTGAYDVLQEKLREAGFADVYVHENSPAVDPDIFLAEAFNMTSGDGLQCGEPEAICAQLGGELVVNGDLYSNLPKYSIQCGMHDAYDSEADFKPAECGEGFQCGEFDGYQSTYLDAVYQVPTNPGYWPLIFFIGGPATRDVNGYLTEIKFCDIPSERRLEFRRIILKFKPMHSWAGVICIYG